MTVPSLQERGLNFISTTFLPNNRVQITTNSHHSYPDQKFRLRSQQETLGVRILVDMKVFQKPGRDVVDKAMHLQTPRLHSVQNVAVFLQAVDLGENVELCQTIGPVGNIWDRIELLAIGNSDFADSLQPSINQSKFLVSQGIYTSAAGRVAAYNDMLDLLSKVSARSAYRKNAADCIP